MDLSLKMIAAVSILTLKVNITRAPVKECSAFRIKQRYWLYTVGCSKSYFDLDIPYIYNGLFEN